MKKDSIRVLFLSDSHLGFDSPERPRVIRRRRGPEFFEAFDRALEPVYQGLVDVVVHGGDLFYRSRVKSWLVLKVLSHIRPVLELGIPFVIVPGNHERSEMPLRLLWDIPNLYTFDEPRSFLLKIKGQRLVLAGFPYARSNLGSTFPRLIGKTRWGEIPSDVRLLCLHQIVEGAVVGSGDYTFREGRDVIPGRLIPSDFAAFLAGHVHRFQVLERDLCARMLGCPVLYSGSTERTSFAERTERKGYLILELVPSSSGIGCLENWVFQELPTRPMSHLDCL